jgi:hypothetical protein
MDSADEDEVLDEEWPLKEPREVLADRKIRFPPLAQRMISADHPTKGTSVYWNIEPESEFVFISQSPARKDGYVFISRTTVENPDGEHTKIRAPNDLPENIRFKFEVTGSYMVYLASREMLLDDNPSAWIVPWTTFSKLLPGENTSPENVSGIVSRNPGFLPTSI